MCNVFCPHLFAGEKDNKYYGRITSCTGKQKMLESCKLLGIEKQVTIWREQNESIRDFFRKKEPEK
ncbi:hypothetical protein JCM13369A_17040 [Mediterraneibacter glycyrrhizinilyticus JCM 13369]